MVRPVPLAWSAEPCRQWLRKPYAMREMMRALCHRHVAQRIVKTWRSRTGARTHFDADNGPIGAWRAVGLVLHHAEG
jgi:hypothetical protein